MFKLFLTLSLFITLTYCATYNAANVTQLVTALNSPNVTDGDIFVLANGTYGLPASVILPDRTITILSYQTAVLQNTTANSLVLYEPSVRNRTVTIQNIIMQGVGLFVQNGSAALSNLAFNDVSGPAIAISLSNSTLTNITFNCNSAPNANTAADLYVASNASVVYTPPAGQEYQYACVPGGNLTVVTASGPEAAPCNTNLPSGNAACNIAPQPQSPQPPQAPQPPQSPQPAEAPQPEGTPQPAGAPVSTPVIVIVPTGPTPNGPTPTPTPTPVTPGNTLSCYDGILTSGNAFTLPSITCAQENARCVVQSTQVSFPTIRRFGCSDATSCQNNDQYTCCCDTNLCNNNNFQCNSPASVTVVSFTLLLAAIVAVLFN